MSFISKITGQDARRNKKLQKSEAQYGGNVGTQLLAGMKGEHDLSDAYHQQEMGDRNSFIGTLEGGQKALEASTMAAMSAAMPSLFQALQGTKESNIRRGIYNGQTPTSYEGDVTSAFQRNIANATAGQAMNLYDTQVGGREHLLDLSAGQSERARMNYYDLIASKLDRDEVKRNRKSQELVGLVGGIGRIGAAIAGGKG